MTGDQQAAATARQADAHGHDTGGVCLNCGTHRIGGFCHACGQSAHVHRSLGGIGHDLAHGVFHFEGRIWHTLPLLLTRPGELTRRYIDGERARFVSPLALFLFIIFVIFAMLSVIGAHLELPEMKGTGRAEIAREVAANGERMARLNERRAQAATPAAQARVDAAIAEQRREAATLQTAMAAGRGDLTGLARLKTGWKRLDKGLAKAAENPNLILYKLQSNAYKFAWALIPLSLPFMWLLFPFSRRFTSYDHAVFVTYSLCFVSLFLAAMSLLGMAGINSGMLFLLATIAIPLHMYKQLRGTYAIGRWNALLRMALLFVGANVAIVFFALLLVGLGLVG